MTRDGRIQAGIVTLAPEVSGWVTTLAIKDKQHVKKGDVVFQIDTRRYQAVAGELPDNVGTQVLALELPEHGFNANIEFCFSLKVAIVWIAFKVSFNQMQILH